MIIDQEQALLEKQGWPLPVECPADRQARRNAMRNPRTLTKSTCDKCGKEIIISFIRQPGDTVYCHEDYQAWVDSIKSYNSAYAKGIEQCTNVLFGRDLINCMDCLGCADLKNEKYCILNKQYTPEEYEKEKQSILSTIDLTVLGKK